MRSKKIFRQAMSVAMAVVMSASSVFPVYASDTAGDTDTTSETTVDLADLENDSTVSEAEESETPETEDYEPYVLYLPKMEGVEYSYDESHLEADLSADSYDILLYEENEQVDMTVKTDMEVAVVDAITEDVIVPTEDIKDGKISFVMPAADLMLQFTEDGVKQTEAIEVPADNEEEPVVDVPVENQTETDEVQSETVSEEQSESVAETETVAETDSAAETTAETETVVEESEITLPETEEETDVQTEEESEKQIQVDLQTEIQTEDADEEEPPADLEYEIVDEKDMEQYLIPEAGSTVYDSNKNVYFRDTEFDYKSYVPDTDGVDQANVSWESGELNFNEAGTYDIIYKAVLKDDESYFWYIDVPMNVIISKDAATVGSDGYEDKLLLRQDLDPKYKGEIPEKIGDHITGPDLVTVKGEELSLKDINFDYDMDVFTYDVVDEGGLDVNTPGVYNIVYRVTTFQDPTVYFFIDCTLTVKDAIGSENAMTVHVKSTELKASVTDVDGESYEAGYGQDVAVDKNLKEIVVAPAWKSNPDVEPVVSVLKNGEEADKEGIVESETKDGNNLIVTLNENLLTGDDKYVFVVDYPTYDPTKGGAVKCNERRSEDFISPLEASRAESADGIATYAASVSKSWEITSYSNIVSYYDSCTNRNPAGTAYRGAEIQFTSDFRKEVAAWIKKNGATFDKTIPETMGIECNNQDGSHAAWMPSLGYIWTYGNLTCTLETNAKGEYSALLIEATAYSHSGFQTFEGYIRVPVSDASSDLKIVKTSRGEFTTTLSTVRLNCTFSLYSDKDCTKRVTKIRLNGGDNAGKLTKTVTGLDPGKYWVKETGRAVGHTWNTKIYPVTLIANKTTTLNIENQPFFFNGQFLAKTDANTKTPLANAVFKVTGTAGKTNPLVLGTWYFRTDDNGAIYYDEAHYLASWNGNNSDPLIKYGVDNITYALPASTTLTCQEVESPAGYKLNSQEFTAGTYSVDPGVLTQPQMAFDPISVDDESDTGKLKLQKKDKDLDAATTPNGEYYSLANAKYSVRDASGNEVAELVTKADGSTDEITLPVGAYSVVEKENPLGYELDPEVHNVTVTFGQTATVESKEQPTKGALNIHKKLDPELPDAIRNEYDLTKIIFKMTYNANPSIVKIKNADANGDVTFDGLYLGAWTVEEINAPEYHEPMQPRTVVINSNSTDAMEYTVTNYRYQSDLEIQKLDIDTGNLVARAGATFQIKDKVGNLVSLTLRGASEKTDTFTTTNRGQIFFSEKIPAGKYTLVEIIPPKGYKIADPVEFEITGEHTSSTIVMKDKRVTTSVNIKKLDASTGANAGAGFGFNIIADEDITDASGKTYDGWNKGAVVDSLVTGADGTAASKQLYPGKYHITETTPGVNFFGDAEDQAFEIVETEVNGEWVAEVDGVKDHTFTFKDTPVMRPIQVVKTDSVTGNSAGSEFVYTITADKVLDGTGAEREGYTHGTVVQEIRTNGKGIATSKDLYLGTYVVKETVRNNNYTLSTKEYKVEVKDEDKATTPVILDATNTPVMKKVQVTKIDAVSGNHCGAGYKFKIVAVADVLDGSGNVYEGYEKGAVVDTIVTGEDGIATSKPLYMGSYYIQEVEVPDGNGMLINTEKYPFVLRDTKGKDGSLDDIKDTDEPMVVKIDDIADQPLMRSIQVVKSDSVTGNAAGAEFVYTITADKVVDDAGVEREGFTHGTVVDTIKTDGKGVAVSKDLYIGTYVVKETVRNNNYTLSTKEYKVEVKDEKKSTAPVVVKTTDTPVMKKVQVTKIDAVSGNHCGAGYKFQIVAAENVVDGSGKVYDGFGKGSVVDTITTDKNGIATSKELYMGSYYIQEIEVPAGNGMLLNPEKYPFVLSDNKKDNIKDTDAPLVVKIDDFADQPLMRPIQVQKKDSVTGNAAGAEFTFTITAENVVDESGAVRKGFEKGTVLDTITTDGRGIATSKDLYIGTYVVKETVRKENYVLSTKEYKVEVKDENKSTAPVTVEIKDNPLTKSIQVTKIDKVTGNHCGAGFVFQIVAAADAVDGSGNVYEGFKAGDVVDTITTDEDGIATSKQLYMGSYYIQEIEVSEDGGMAINETKYPFTLSDTRDENGNLTDIKDTDEPIVYPIDDIADKPTTLKLKKTDSIQKDKDGNPKLLHGITFRIKAKDAEDSDDQLYVTDKDGSIKVEYLKKNTTYTIQEVETIKGYNLNEEVYEFSVDDKGLINGSDTYEITITNQPNEVHISKVDITNGEELKGASMKLTDMDGNVIDEWVSDGTPHILYGMADGKYRLVESIAPEKYEVATSISQSNLPADETEKANVEGLNSEGIFTVENSLVVQQVTMKDSPFRWVEISKKMITGDDELPGCKLTVKDAQGEVVDSWTSTEEAHKIQLSSGVYTLTEEKPADGYTTADTITFEVVKTSETDYAVMPVVMRDEVTKVTISKKDITNGEEIPGAHLVIKNEQDEIVEEWTSTEEPHYIEKLPIGKYTLTEITAPDDYEVAETIEFEVKDTMEIQHVEMFDSPYRDVTISKKDITNKEELPGATLEILDKDNKVVDSWTSTKEAHLVKLPHGKYTLVERKPADGYTTAESISFEVLERNTEGDIEVQHVEMQDDITKVEISKQDVTTEKELPGAKLQIKDSKGKVVEEWTSTDKPHYIEKLAIGKYTLTEITAPDGYDVAENVDFEVLDTGDIQHVIMYDSPTPVPGTDVPGTGDINPVIPIAGVILVGALAGIGIYFVRKKNKKSDK